MQSLDSETTPQAIVDKIRQCLSLHKGKTLGLHEPVFQGREWEFLKECLDSGWVSSVGKFVDRFETMLSNVTGLHGAVAVVNGTSALHLCLRIAGVTADDEVLVPALSFVAPANAITYCGAVPHFVDSEPVSFGVDAAKLETYLEEIAESRGNSCWNRKTGRRLSALIAVHVFGHPCDLDALAKVCERFHITLIEDCAEALGSYYKGRHVGYAGKLSAFSFNGNKTITTGGGGAVLTTDENLRKEAKHLSTTAKVPHPWDFHHDEVGYNYRMPNINAAIGCAQIEQLETFLEKKRSLAARYKKHFQDMIQVRFVTEPPYAKSNYWLNAIMLEENAQSSRDSILDLCHKEGILARPAWNLLHELPMFSGAPRMDMTTAKSLQKRLINIPSSSFL